MAELLEALGDLSPGEAVAIVSGAAAPDPSYPSHSEPNKFWRFMIALWHEQGWGVRDAAAALGVSEVDLTEMARANKLPPLSERRRWARALGYSESIAFEGDWRGTRVHLQAGAVSESGRRLIKIVNKAPAGEPWDYEEAESDSGVGFDYVEAPPHLAAEAMHELFAFIVVGRSMLPEYSPGDLVFALPVDQRSEVRDQRAAGGPNSALPDGAAVFIRFTPDEPRYGGRCTFKCYWPHDEAQRMRLVPLNPEAGGEIAPLREHVARMAAAVHVEKDWWAAGRVSRPRRIERDVDCRSTASEAE